MQSEKHTFRLQSRLVLKESHGNRLSLVGVLGNCFTIINQPEKLKRHQQTLLDHLNGQRAYIYKFPSRSLFC
eukprot:gene7513-5297_t